MKKLAAVLALGFFFSTLSISAYSGEEENTGDGKEDVECTTSLTIIWLGFCPIPTYETVCE